MRAFRGPVPRAAFLAALPPRERFVQGRYFDAETGCGCFVGLGAAVACRLAGQALAGLPDLAREHPTVPAPFYWAAENLLGFPPELLARLDNLFEAAPSAEAASELAALGWAAAPDNASLGSVAERYAELAARRPGLGWYDRGDMMLRLLAGAPSAAPPPADSAGIPY